MAVKSQNTKVFAYNGSGYQEVNGIESFSAQGGEAETIDTTALGDASPTSVRGQETPQTAEFSIMYDPADTSHTLVETLKTNAANVNWRVNWGFSGSGNVNYWTGQVISFPALPSAERNSVLRKTLQVSVNNYRNSA